MDSHYDPDRLAVPDNSNGDMSREAAPTPRRGRPVRYLRGPVPWAWLSRAMKLPGSALAVGLLLWLRRGITKKQTFTFCLSRVVAEGIPETTARRAINELERAELIVVRRLPGRGLEVTLRTCEG
jgi:hypothetical protein